MRRAYLDDDDREYVRDTKLLLAQLIERRGMAIDELDATLPSKPHHITKRGRLRKRKIKHVKPLAWPPLSQTIIFKKPP